MNELLKVDHLRVAFDSDRGRTVGVDDVSFRVMPGETLAIVGESGSGKSVTALSIMRLLGGNSRVEEGRIMFDGRDLLELDDPGMRSIRGNQISMIFQEPMTSLNPVLSIGFQMREAIMLHMGQSKKEAHATAIRMLEKVGLPRPEKMMNEYPFALSGGMRQRVMIAMALSCKPKLLIADEPTTALDVTVQAQIMTLMQELCREAGAAILLITHDLGVVAEMADRVVVMYAGQVVEEADVFELFEQPRHPYTQGLLKSIPRIDATNDEQLESIPGAVPARYESIPGCRFTNRCPYATDRCAKEMPLLSATGEDHFTRCWEVRRAENGLREEEDSHA
ncbi:ABC transporter ATP-binding protein [Paenibacillus sp. Marseille-P2973]|uniref:ABC transporter ATP-binding protein n=1 Tax=Paenibacillus sp. Marseille-P2973 TaxID=1871032 RepID=UPI001B36CB9B|nr:ABC transporter ATP-binding protein [Paenibacillus sp. Marseille-P2973]MBQ4902006.1 ABC transporter ATP-binding protein [Paenibacillus sp. Marseille-P2973]